MFDNAKRKVQDFKDTNKHYSDMGKQNAKELMRSRQDEHKDEYIGNSEYYSQYLKEQHEKFKKQSLWHQILIFTIVLLVTLLVLWGWLG